MQILKQSQQLPKFMTALCLEHRHYFTNKKHNHRTSEWHTTGWARKV